MDLVGLYGQGIIKNINNGQTDLALSLVKLGLSLEKVIIKYSTDEKVPNSLRYLNNVSLDFLKNPLKYPENSGWVNLLAPSELLHAMDIHPLFIEAFSSFMTGFRMEDYLIDCAEKEGIAETLCSYHKAFIGAGVTGLLPKPKFAIASSMICDGNINTFRFLSHKYNIPFYGIDIPNEYNEDSEEYVVNQLKEVVDMMEQVMGRKLNNDKLKEVLKIENETRQYKRKFVYSLGSKYFPNTLTLEMYKLFTTYTFMGTKETYEFYKMMANEIENYPKKHGIRIFWVHLLPFYHKILREFFDLNDKYQILGCDLDFNYLNSIDYENPYHAIAKKMLLEQYNGNFDRKVESITKLIDILKPDGVINFCHWGCKQSNGGVMLLKDVVKSKGIPFLSLDGDAVDKRNSHDGQIKTRVEAFLEMIEKQKNKEISK